MLYNWQQGFVGDMVLEFLSAGTTEIENILMK